MAPSDDQKGVTSYAHGKNPNSLANLDKGRNRPWGKGESGNPSGRPKLGKSITRLVRNYLAMTPQQFYGDPPDETSMADLIAWDMVFTASGSIDPTVRQRGQAAILDRIEGPVAKVEPEGETSEAWVELIEDLQVRYVELTATSKTTAKRGAKRK